MKVLITGSKGMLGSDLISELKNNNIDYIGMNRDELDITDKNTYTKIHELNVDVIINCAAYTNVELSEKERKLCKRINSEGVNNLVNFCKEKNITLLHLSTDYVFDGKKGYYNEDDEKNPINWYGHTKSEGENNVIQGLKNYYIVRTAWLFGKHGKNFVEAIIRLSNKKKEIKVVDDQRSTPTFTKDLSKALVKLIKEKYPFGIYHITNSEECTWFEFAKEIVKLKKADCIVNPCSSKEYPTIAKRPKSTVLVNNKFPKLRSWKEALKEYLEVE